MLGLCKHAQLPQLFVQVCHVFSNSGLYRAEVVILHLLPLGGGGAEKGAPCHDKILTPVVQLLGDKEVFLLGANGGLYAGGICAEEL